MAETGFDLGGGLCQRGGGGRKSLKVLKVEKSFFSVFSTIFLLKLCLKLIASEEKMRNISVWGIKKS